MERLRCIKDIKYAFSNNFLAYKVAPLAEAIVNLIMEEIDR